MTRILLLFVFLASLTAFFACSDDTDTAFGGDIASEFDDFSKDEALFEEDINYINIVASEQFAKMLVPTNNKTLVTAATAEPCYTATITSFDYLAGTATLLIDFGTVGCPDEFGVVRTGKILLSSTFSLQENIINTTYEFNNYTVHGYAVTGSLQAINQLDSSFSKYIFQNLNYTATNDHFTRSGYLDSTLETTGATVKENLYRIGYNYTATDDTNTTYKLITIEPVYRQLDCSYFPNKGVTKIINQGSGLVFFLNYGDGTCDDKATLYNENHSFHTEITLTPPIIL